MAKMKKKINKNRMNKKSVQAKQAFTSLKHDMQQLMAEENYVDAIDVMAEMATNRQMDGEVMYWGAQCYFMTGDFERAEKWVNNALNNGYNSAGLKLLLAALCMAEDRDEEGFKLCDIALSEGVGEMSIQEKEILANFMDNISYGYDELVAKHPAIQEYLKKNSDSDAQQPAAILAAAADAVEENQEPAPAQSEADANEDKAQAALARLRQLLAKNKAAESQQENEAAKEQAETTITRETLVAEPVKEEAIQPAEEVPAVEEQEAEQKNDEDFDVAGTLEKIAAKEASLAEKVRLINVFAGACYQSGDYQAAFDLLSAALEIDGQDAATLKNIAYTCLSAGEKEQALSFAAKLPVVDFGLLYALKQD